MSINTNFRFQTMRCGYDPNGSEYGNLNLYTAIIKCIIYIGIEMN